MNYRHAFHAGNFADCMKHALLHALLVALRRKPAPFHVLDTHAGIGRYDLHSSEAERTGEWRAGIGKLLGITEGPLAPWLDLVRREGGPYSGSPALASAMLREGDRLTLVELHEADHATLRAAFRRDKRVSVHRRDAAEAVRALLPFPEKRGLVLLDPPFEQPGEYGRLVAAMAETWRRSRGLVQAAWYPVKGRAPARAFHAALRDSGIRDIVAAELHLREPTDAARLNGSGLAIVNPPFGFEEEARAILTALHAALATGEAGGGWTLERIADE
ncbi:23S rRNA (adenine(2030)-N(6))-methyltransferase RlmJ [Roseococcus sp. MDT2-1-1]|uniref:Ribosomal RNA large subunit methyltransferase J n=2 Tax=Sabulicella glaciei TaxID=2984948 RepID=A0ABT3P0C5_9PROT|nr:23S rRNA (adenine(2030)-N(6))-methyltransferase RlmJ [Roseococcus sp. MDT2-1-1]MCW8087861.1 23S rRNA (adenine(2030)-N(6))-methyltransferase RlmJ [Roseococcus sp. MDT2-1-1]